MTKMVIMNLNYPSFQKEKEIIKECILGTPYMDIGGVQQKQLQKGHGVLF